MNIECLEAISLTVNIKIASFQAMAGGDHASAWCLTGQDGQRFFLKEVSEGAPFKSEALGLQRLICKDGMRVPKVLAAGERFLCLEWIDFARPDENTQQMMGHQLAHTHLQCRGNQYGFDDDHFIGATPQKNQPWVPPSPGKWTEFWWTHRLSPMFDRLGDGVLGKLGMRLSERLEDLLVDPAGDPSLLHGDLWSGNVGVDTRGQPLMYDPAPYYGHFTMF